MATRKPKNVKKATQKDAPLTKEQVQKIKEKAYAEYQRYMDNAKENLKKAGKENNFYIDSKYTKTACSIAYCGVLLMLDAWIEINGKTLTLSRGQRKSIDYYRENVRRNTTLLNLLNNAYNTLHLSGSYDGELKYTTIQDGLSTFTDIAQFVKP